MLDTVSLDVRMVKRYIWEESKRADNHCSAAANTWSRTNQESTDLCINVRLDAQQRAHLSICGVQNGSRHNVIGLGINAAQQWKTKGNHLGAERVMVRNK